MSRLVPRALMVRTVAREAARRHWLQMSRCQGFRVWTPRGKLGVVERVVLEEWGEPRGLVVRRGPFRRRRVTIPAREVSLVDPDRRSVFAEIPARGRQPTAFREIIR